MVRQSVAPSPAVRDSRPGYLPTFDPAAASGTLLHCPIRGQLNAAALAKDGLTATEEARRIDFIKFLLGRNYPEDNIAVETVIIKSLGESGRNQLRCDVIVYDVPVDEIANHSIDERIKKAALVAEIKRDTSKKASAWEHQLEPAMRLLPGIRVMGVYWDSVNRLLFVKQIVKDELRIFQDSLSNLPEWGRTYKRKLLAHADLAANPNLVGLLFSIANVMRSHGINDEHVRYKETVKLILARYCDEREAEASPSRPLALQVYPESDPDFMDRVRGCYRTAAKRYSRAKTLFGLGPATEMSERTLKAIVKQIQGANFRSASNETMQQVFMSFVPAVFKKSLDQYFTPPELVKAMVHMVRIGPNDKIADPGMGTADFLTAACEDRMRAGDTDIMQRIFGFDSDPRAFDLAVVNMILNKDGQSNLYREDSIENYARFAGEMGVVLCNPPFGKNGVENRAAVLKHYDLGHEWEQDEGAGAWKKTARILDHQQLGILFIEKCYKLLDDGGRVAIVLLEGYLCTSTYGYVRQWLVERLRILALVELPRRIFLKSNADLRSNVLVAQKLSAVKMKRVIEGDYPVYAGMVRKVGFKMGKGHTPLFVRDQETGIEIRDQNNERIPDTDFRRVGGSFDHFTAETRWQRAAKHQPVPEGWAGATIGDVLRHPSLDLKPRRLMPAALKNVRDIKAGDHVTLSRIASVVKATVDIVEEGGTARTWRMVAGEDIRAVEGVVAPSAPMRAWRIAERKKRMVYRLRDGDIIVGLVRPERRNIGLLLADGDDIVGIPDGIAVVRVMPEFRKQYPQEWLFAALRSEPCRLQFWTESGGTSYGKLTDTHIEGVIILTPPPDERREIAARVGAWAASVRESGANWSTIGSANDRRPILNSSGFGLIETDDGDEGDDEEEGEENSG